jgi:plastocyanin
MRTALTRGLLTAAVVAVTAAACGGGSSTPTNPTPPPTGGGGGGGGPQQTATITIGSDGRVTPSSVTVAVGGRVTMINNHNVPHEMESDPHPDHTDCPEMSWGFLQPGQQRTTGNLNRARTCGFHDHNRDTDPNLRGSVIIQ